MDAVAYWTAQQTYRKELAVARAAANKSAPPSSSSSASISASISSSSAALSLDLINFRPSAMVIMEAKPTVPQVRADTHNGVNFHCIPREVFLTAKLLILRVANSIIRFMSICFAVAL